MLQRKLAQMQEKIDSLTQINISNEVKILDFCRDSNKYEPRVTLDKYIDQHETELCASVTSKSISTVTADIDIIDEREKYRTKLLELDNWITKAQSDHESKLKELEQRNVALEAVNLNL